MKKGTGMTLYTPLANELGKSPHKQHNGKEEESTAKQTTMQQHSKMRWGTCGSEKGMHKVTWTLLFAPQAKDLKKTPHKQQSNKEEDATQKPNK